MLDMYVLVPKAGRDEPVAIYFSLIAIGGGLGLLGSYRMEKTWWEKQEVK